MGKKRGMKAYKLATVCLTCLFLVVICACSLPGYYESTTVKLNKNDSITHYIVEDFDDSQYEYEELVADIKKEVEDYNSQAGAEMVELSGVAYQNNKVRITLKYEDDDAYYNMNGYSFYYDSCSNAAKSGYNPVSKAKSTQNGEYLDADTWSKMTGSYRIVVVHEPIRIEAPSNILYVSDNVTLDGERVATTNNEDLAYIIF